MTPNPKPATSHDAARIAALKNELRDARSHRDRLAEFTRYLERNRRSKIVGMRAATVGPAHRAHHTFVHLAVAIERLLDALATSEAPVGAVESLEHTVRFWRDQSRAAARVFEDEKFVWNLRAQLWQKKAAANPVTGELVPLKRAEPDEFNWMSPRRFELFAIGKEGLLRYEQMSRQTGWAHRRMSSCAANDAEARSAARSAMGLASTLHIASYRVTAWMVEVIDPDVTDESVERSFPVEALDEVGSAIEGRPCAAVLNWLTKHEEPAHP
jgi:hypothetical protein